MSTAYIGSHRAQGQRGVALAFVVLVAVLGCTLSAPRAEVPSSFTWVTPAAATSAHAQTLVVARALERTLDMEVHLEEEADPAARVAALASGRAFAATLGSEAILAQEGIGRFAEEGHGPQPLTLILQGHDTRGLAFVVAADTGVERLRDLAGLRVAWVRGAPLLNRVTTALLAAGDLGWDDVQRYEIESWTGLGRAAAHWRVDAYLSPSPAPDGPLLERSPRGLVLVSPPSDGAAWTRLEREAPWLVEGRDGNPYAPYPNVVVNANTPATSVEALTRALVELVDREADRVPGLAGWSASRQRYAEAFLPVHTGTIDHLEEVGHWDARADSPHTRLRQRQQVLRDAWDETEGDVARWLQARARALQAAGLDEVFRAIDSD